MAITTETLSLTAADLRPGDLVLDENGERDHAAFDVDVRGETVTIWPAMADRRLDWPREFTVPATTPYTVTRTSRA